MPVDLSSIEAVFSQAMEIPEPEARAAYLDRACAVDSELRRQVLSLIDAHEHAGRFLASPTASFKHGSPEPVGSTVGPYKLLEPIGEGGMGVVYMAEQTAPVRRRVALKVIKPGMDTRQVIARFEAERQALAMMDHPNIARVLDAGATDSGRPYFVMELVRGIPITDYCDREQLSIPERLELFVLVCRAVQHAHQKGVIHRDIKPSNVLVTVVDGVPVPKVIDFGVAKATGASLTERTLVTGFHQLVGTPLYMSPEQADLAGTDVDTRSDIYALGVLLYELLTGTTPFDQERFCRAAFDEVRRIVREEEPPRPSTRLSTLGESLSTVSAKRKTAPRQLSHTVQGELDWIAMKALEKDRMRRYETANDFAADIMRYLNDEPVEACPPCARYRFVKFARRHRAGLTTAALVAMALLGGTAVSAWQAIQAARARQAVTAVNETLRETLYFNRIALADRELLTGDLRVVDQLLSDCPTDLRGWEWRYLKRARAGYLPLVCRAPSPIFTLAFSPDGTRMASGHVDGTVRIWDARSGKHLRELSGHRGPVHAIAFSRDGWRIASQGDWDDGTMRIWDVVSGARILPPIRLPGVGFGLSFSPDGRSVVVACSAARYDEKDDTAIKVWDATTGEPVRTIRDAEGARSLAHSPDGHKLATAGGRGTVKILDAMTWEVLHVLRDQMHQSDRVLRVSFSTDGRILASTSDDGATEKLRPIKLWDVRTGRLIRTLAGHTRVIWAVAFSPDGTRLATASFDQKVKLWEASSGREALTLLGHTDAAMDLAFSPDGTRLATAGGDRTIRIWDASPLTERPARQVASLVGHTDDVRAVAYGLDGRTLVSAGDDRIVRTWDAATGMLLSSLPGHGGTILGLTISPDGRTIATCGDDNTWPDGGAIRIRDAKTGAVKYTLTTFDQGCILSLAFSPDGRTLATGDVGNEVRTWDAVAGKLLHKGMNPWAVDAVAFSPDGKQIVSGSRDGAVNLWEASSVELIRPIDRLAGRVSSVAWSPNGQHMAAAGGDGNISIWETRTWAKSHTIPAHHGRALGLAFSLDSRRLGSGGADQTAKVWDVATGRELLALRGHLGEVNSVAFSPDGRRLASAGGDHIVKIWDAMPGPNATP